MVFQTDGTAGFYIYLSGIASWTRVTTESNLDLPAVLALGKDAGTDSILNLGALGIGTSNPTAPFHFFGLDAIFQNSGNNRQLTIDGNGEIEVISGQTLYLNRASTSRVSMA